MKILDIYLCGMTVLVELISIMGLAILIQLISYRVFRINLYKKIVNAQFKLDKYLVRKFG